MRELRQGTVGDESFKLFPFRGGYVGPPAVGADNDEAFQNLSLLQVGLTDGDQADNNDARRQEAGCDPVDRSGGHTIHRVRQVQHLERPDQTDKHQKAQTLPESHIGQQEPQNPGMIAMFTVTSRIHTRSINPSPVEATAILLEPQKF